jgi:peptidoglycan/LPS O-acetylase OafA/YrhL
MSHNQELTSPLFPDPTIPGRAGEHYPALDGLRGVAILLVLVFHGSLGLSWNGAGPLQELFETGWIGVDIFFVLSGFLITGILLDSKASPRYFLNFYARRVLRLVPAYFLLLVIVFVVLPHFVKFNTPGLITIRDNQIWFWTYMTNWSFVWHRKVFANADWLNLNHLWSLSVEEQFYLFWPLLIYYLNKSQVTLLCCICIIGSLTLRIALWLLHEKSGALYFPTVCRLDGLAIGSMLAVQIRNTELHRRLTATAMQIGVAAGCGILILGYWRGGFRFNDNITIVFGIFMVAAFTGALLPFIAREVPNTSVARVLCAFPLRAAGKYSYGIYLFHEVLRVPLQLAIPVDILRARLGIGELAGNIVWMGLFLSVSCAVAFMSWHLYEKQCLKLKQYFAFRPHQWAPIKMVRSP